MVKIIQSARVAECDYMTRHDDDGTSFGNNSKATGRISGESSSRSVAGCTDTVYVSQSSTPRAELESHSAPTNLDLRGSLEMTFLTGHLGRGRDR